MVLTDQRFGTSQLVIKNDCLDADCAGECVEVCTPRVLKLADEEQSKRLMIHPNWEPVAVLLEEVE